MCNTTTPRIAAETIVVPATRSVASGAEIMESDCLGGSSTDVLQPNVSVAQPVTSEANGRAISINQSVHIRPEYHPKIW